MQILSSDHFDEMFDVLSHHRPFRSFMTYFDMTNFWFSDYEDLPPDLGPYGVLESWDGEMFLLNQMNCGYGGMGPHRTQDALEWLGISKEKTDRWIWHNGIEVHFDKNGSLNQAKLKLGAPFDSREGQGSIVLRDDIFADRQMKRLYFVNPQYGNYASLWKALELCEAADMTWYCGPNAEAYVPYNSIVSSKPLVGDRLERMSLGGFVQIKGEHFQVYCLVESGNALNVIQNLYSHFFQRPLFYESEIRGIPILIGKRMYSRWDYIKYILHMLWHNREPFEAQGSARYRRSLNVRNQLSTGGMMSHDTIGKVRNNMGDHCFHLGNSEHNCRLGV